MGTNWLIMDAASERSPILMETYTVHKGVQFSEGGCCTLIIYEDCYTLFGFSVFSDNLMQL